MQDRDRGKESQLLIDEWKKTLLQVTFIESGAVGLATAFSVALFDWTGAVGAGVLAFTGVFAIPYRRSQVKIEMTRRLAELQKQLMVETQRHFDSQLADHLRKMRMSISPYEHFVRTEQTKLRLGRESIEELNSSLFQLREEALKWKENV